MDECRSLKKAKEFLHHNTPDLILLDLNLPDSEALPTFFDIQEHYSHIPIIIFTHIESEFFALEAVRRGAQDYLIKSNIRRDELIRAIRYAIARFHAQLEVNTTKRKLSSLIQNTPLGYIECNDQLRITSWNPSADTIFNINRKQAIDRPIQKLLFYSVHNKNLSKKLNHALISKENIQLCIDHGQSKHCPQRICQWYITPVSHLLDNSTHLSCLIQDITEQTQADKQLNEQMHVLSKLNTELKDTQSELIQAGKLTAIGQLAAEMAHEINNPLGAIRIHTEEIISDIECNQADIKEIHESAQSILRSTNKVSEAVHNMKLFSRQSDNQFSKIDIHTPINHAIEIINPHLKKTSIQLKNNHHSSPLFLWANTNRLEQLFVNLLLNAIDALSESDQSNKEIIIQTNHSKNMINIDIMDNGIGISDHVKDSIFTPFFTTKKEGKGVGLGLAIVLRIIDDHCGKINICNHTKDYTHFQITLPIDRRQGTRT